MNGNTLNTLWDPTLNLTDCLLPWPQFGCRIGQPEDELFHAFFTWQKLEKFSRSNFNWTTFVLIFTRVNSLWRISCNQDDVKSVTNHSLFFRRPLKTPKICIACSRLQDSGDNGSKKSAKRHRDNRHNICFLFTAFIFSPTIPTVHHYLVRK